MLQVRLPIATIIINTSMRKKTETIFTCSLHITHKPPYKYTEMPRGVYENFTVILLVFKQLPQCVLPPHMLSSALMCHYHSICALFMN